MTRAGLLLGLAVCASLRAAALVLTPETTEVVLAPDAPKTVRFAADEMTNVLARAFGRPVPVVTAPTAGRTPIFLGASDWARRAGLETEGLAPDAFTILCDGKGVYIAGRDDPAADLADAVRSPWKGVWSLYHERATLFGVYEFLERAVKARFYFPGELGTIVPRTESIRIGTGRRTIAPDYRVRNYSWAVDGVYFEGENREKTLLPARKLQYLRNRMQTELVPCCHGLRGFNIQTRFGATHPEYMALIKENGKLVRDLDPNTKTHHPGQICHSSAVYDEVFKDICSYARGEGPEVRGAGSRLKGGRWTPGWSISTFRRPWVDIMPQDGMKPCFCPACQSAYRTNEFHYASELIWGRTVELANRLKAAGINDIRITQMAYTPYRRIPDIDIPDNVDVMVAEGGPWSLRNPVALTNELAEIRGWSEKLGRRVWAWTYVGKYKPLNLPNIPCGTPRAWGWYYKAIAPWVFGCYAESECDRAFYNYLSYYVLGKVCWNTKTDVSALLDEYFARMFGPAAGEMQSFSDDMERLWLGGVCGRIIETDLGPKRHAPSPYDLYARIYSPDVLKRWDGWLKAARAKVADGSLEARRIDLYRRECYEPLAAASAAFFDGISVPKEVARRAAHPERRNLLVNGDFSQTEWCRSDRHFGLWKNNGYGWRGGWIAGQGDGPRISFVTDVPKGVRGKAMRIAGDAKHREIAIGNHFTETNGRLKPGQRYRVSFFVRLKGVVPYGHEGGARMKVWCDHNTFFPQNALTGTTDWMHQSFEFVAGPKSAEFNSQFRVSLWNATGQVDYADLRLEEIPSGEEARGERPGASGRTSP